MVTTGGAGCWSPCCLLDVRQQFGFRRRRHHARIGLVAEFLGDQRAVSWSMVWVMVAITPILNSALTRRRPSAPASARDRTR